MINMEYDSSHGVIHNIKLFIFKIRIFFMSLLRGEKDVETPDVVKSLINLDKLSSFEPHILFGCNPKDAAASSSEPFMEKVRNNLKTGSVECTVVNDSKLFKYAPFTKHTAITESGEIMSNVERLESWKEKIKAQMPSNTPQHNQI